MSTDTDANATTPHSATSAKAASAEAAAPAAIAPDQTAASSASVSEAGMGDAGVSEAPKGDPAAAEPTSGHAAPIRGEPGLNTPVLEHLGQKLRSAYNEVAEKPAYLGDTTLPPEVEHQLVRLGDSVRAGETGLQAVKEALLGPAPEQPESDVSDADRADQRPTT